MSRRAIRALAALSALAIGTAGCSSGSGAHSTTPDPGPSAGRPSASSLLACLKGAGLTAALEGAAPVGVSDPVQGVDVTPLKPTASLGGNPGQEAELWVFGSAQLAAKNRVAITLSTTPTPSSWLAGDVVVDYAYPANGADPQVLAIAKCLPPRSDPAAPAS